MRSDLSAEATPRRGDDATPQRAADRRIGFLKGLLVPLALVTISLVVTLLLGEAVVRLLFKDGAVMFPRYHTDYRYGPYTLRGIRPNAEFWHTSVDGSWKFVTNSRGFRNARDFPYEKRAGTLRVLSLGDSHTQGYEVRQDATFSAVLERYLAGRNARAEVPNAGVSGYSTAEALAFLENEGYRYQPDAVVLGFYANDFEDNLKAGLFALDQGALESRKYEHIPGVRIQNAIYAIPGVKWLGENSYLYSIVFNGVWAYFKSALRSHALHATAAEPTDVEYAVANSAEQPEEAVALAAALIERMQRFCAERGIRLIVVDIPMRAGPLRYESSLSQPLMQRLKETGVETVSSHTVLADFDGIAEFHTPHGHHHISEFTHLLIGAELGRRLLAK